MAGKASAAVTPIRRQRTLVQLERIVERGITSFVAVGEALLEIRERQLYTESHATFEAYCKERFGLSRMTAWRRIQVAKAANDEGTPPATQKAAIASTASHRDTSSRAKGARMAASSTSDVVGELRALVRSDPARVAAAIPASDRGPLCRALVSWADAVRREATGHAKVERDRDVTPRFKKR